MRVVCFLCLMMLQPISAWACGGFFCNNAVPVVQSAERILFVPHEGNIHMHVRITYSGPRDDFGWLLPTAPGVEVQLSTESVFDALDALYAPSFNLIRRFDPECDFDSELAEASDASSGSVARSDGGVTILSRQAVGPYDNAVLQAETVQSLRDWLDENNFQIPPAIDDKLGPYVNAGAHFVAIKLRAGQDTGDIAPLYLTFPGETPSVPIVPTSVAADPDMGILVHILGDARAAPKNYLHVRINEAALDLTNGGANYVDVVSQAVDEAGGKAFVTDFADEVADNFTRRFIEIQTADLANGWRSVRGYRMGPPETLADLMWAFLPQPDGPAPGLRPRLWVDVDFQRVAKDVIGLPPGTNGEFEGDDYWACALRNISVGSSEAHPCGVAPDDIPIDWAALETRIESEINPARRHLTEMVAAHPFLTRLYSTMSPGEMTIDPEFMFNRDLETVTNVRNIEVRLRCDDSPPTLINAAGMEVEADLSGESAVVRMDGETVQGTDTPAAAVIERIMAAGASEVVGMMGQMMGPTTDEMMNQNPEGTSSETISPAMPPSGNMAIDSMTNSDRPPLEEQEPAIVMPSDPMGSSAISADEDAGCEGCSNQGRNADAWAILAVLFLGLRRRRK